MPESGGNENYFGAEEVRLIDDAATGLWQREVRDFSPWVLENLEKLGRALGMQLEATGAEVKISAFRADIMATDSSGRSVIIENQFGPSNHGHFGQIVIYALESKADVVIWLVAVGLRERIWGGIRPEHRRALELLNDLLAGKTEFYGVEVTLESEPIIGQVPLDSVPLLPKLTVAVSPHPSG